MRKHMQSLYHSVMAQEVAQCAREQLPEDEQHARRVWDLATQQQFPSRRTARLRLVVPSLAAVFVFGWTLPCPQAVWAWAMGAAPAEAQQIDIQYRDMRERQKRAVRAQVMPRVIRHLNGGCSLTVFKRAIGDPFVLLTAVMEQAPIAKEDCTKAIEEASLAAADG
jgi:hypothetical protein